jgi:hypothetical protein
MLYRLSYSRVIFAKMPRKNTKFLKTATKRTSFCHLKRIDLIFFEDLKEPKNSTMTSFSSQTTLNSAVS